MGHVPMYATPENALNGIRRDERRAKEAKQRAGQEKRSTALRDDDAVAFMFVQEFETFDDPQIETAANVLRYFLCDVPAIF